MKYRLEVALWRHRCLLPSLPEDLLAFLKEVGAYYLAPPGEVMRLALPPVETKTRKAVEQPTLFSRARGVGERKIQVAIPIPGAEPGEFVNLSICRGGGLHSCRGHCLDNYLQHWPLGRGERAFF